MITLWDTPFFEKAKCAEHDPDFFFPVTKQETFERKDQLLAICNSCIHLVECRAHSIKYEIKDGFWGGLTQFERKKIIDQQKSDSAASDCLTCNPLDDSQHLVIESSDTDNRSDQDNCHHETDHHE